MLSRSARRQNRSTSVYVIWDADGQQELASGINSLDDVD
jgi:hypothetical protein